MDVKGKVTQKSNTGIKIDNLWYATAKDIRDTVDNIQVDSIVAGDFVEKEGYIYPLITRLTHIDEKQTVPVGDNPEPKKDYYAEKFKQDTEKQDMIKKEWAYGKSTEAVFKMLDLNNTKLISKEEIRAEIRDWAVWFYKEI